MGTSKEIPKCFESILWSYDFEELDPQKNERVIVFNAINYGNLIHWSWIATRYGKPRVSRIIKESMPSALRPGACVLAKIIFDQNNE